MLLAGVAAVVTGIDISCTAIHHTTSRYGKRANLCFVQGSCVSLLLADESIDIVISFETIEHIAEQNAMLSEFRRVLVFDGILVISSPNKAIYSGETDYVNDYHVRELTREELKSILDARFPQQAWHGQRVLAHSMLWAENSPPERVVDLVALTADGVEALDPPAPALYFLVVCGGHGAAFAEADARLRYRESWQGWLRWPLAQLRRWVRQPAAVAGRSQ